MYKRKKMSIIIEASNLLSISRIIVFELMDNTSDVVGCLWNKNKCIIDFIFRKPYFYKQNVLHDLDDNYSYCEVYCNNVNYMFQSNRIYVLFHPVNENIFMEKHDVKLKIKFSSINKK